MKKSKQVPVKLALMKEALARLLTGKGVHVSPGVTLSMAKLCKEAKVSSGAPYYKHPDYEAFREEAILQINRFNAGLDTKVKTVSDHETRLIELRHDRDNEKRIKIEYREERDALRAEVLKLKSHLVASEHALYLESCRHEELRTLFIKVTGQEPENFKKLAVEVSMKPRNLQLIKG
ncbi:hypothetical protein KUV89_17725 [Marinobacter hydrocarbonoclasticus]|nr:hypothetical protein [Marinobacter nauticus]